MNRRDFIKSALVALGAFLGRGAAARAEAPTQGQDSSVFEEYAAQIDRPALTDEEKQQAFEPHLIGSLLELPPLRAAWPMTELPPDRWTLSTAWFVDLVDGDDSNNGLTPETAVLTRAEAISRCTGHPIDFVLVFPGDSTVETMPDPCPPRGMVWGDIGHGLGHYVHWANDGSDEDGDGRYEHPVATEACAQTIADNPPFRV